MGGKFEKELKKEKKLLIDKLKEINQHTKKRKKK